MLFGAVRRPESQGAGDFGARGRDSGIVYNILNNIENFLLLDRDPVHLETQKYCI